MAVRILAGVLVLAAVAFVISSFVATPPWHGAAPSNASTSTSTSMSTTGFPADSLPGLPAGWPDGLELGVSDAPGGASAMSKALGFRYQYLSGGVNTGNGWATWAPGGDFVTNYVAESRAAQIVPVFSYYQLFQSNPGVSMGESGGVYANLTNPSTMAAYYDDLELFFQKAGAAGGMTVLHVEPDLWA